jgi:hypothetical protein
MADGLPIVDAENPTEDYLKARGPLPGFEQQEPEVKEEEQKEEPTQEEEKVSLSKSEFEAERAKIAKEAAESAKAEYEKSADERKRQAEKDAEDRELEAAYKAALEGQGEEQITAQRKLLQEKLNEINSKRALKQAEPLIKQAQDEFAFRKYNEHMGAFAVDPKDKDVLALDPALGMKGLNALLIEKTADEELVARMLKNPGVKKVLDAVKKEAEKEKKAAKVEGMAKAIGSSRPLEGAKATGDKVYSLDQIEAALAQSPKDKDLQNMWRKAQRKIGRPI